MRRTLPRPSGIAQNPIRSTRSATASIAARSKNHIISKRFNSSCGVPVGDENTVSHYPGAPNVPFTTQMKFVGGFEKFPVYRVMDLDGNVVDKENYPNELDNETLVKLYKVMARQNVIDTNAYNAQRQGRINFYITSHGEEAVGAGAAAATKPEDHSFLHYREQSYLTFKGFTLDEFFNQLYQNRLDYGKGKPLQVHWCSKKLNAHVISAPLATQVPQAAGAGYALKLNKQKAVAVVFFGDGAASEGDAFAGLNFAATLGSQTLFICRNNGWAISTPTVDQYKGDGIAPRGVSLGIPSIRVDGNDVLAMYNATKKAREIVIETQGPALVEAMTYRISHHSTSDDWSKYRSAEEVEYWRTVHNPITRMRKFLERRGLWNQKMEDEWIQLSKKEVLEAMDRAEKAGICPPEELFTDVYDTMPQSIKIQAEGALAHIYKYKDHYMSSSH